MEYYDELIRESMESGLTEQQTKDSLINEYGNKTISAKSDNGSIWISFNSGN